MPKPQLDGVDLPPLTGWALILGASSGFGAACAQALAAAGMDIIGVHLDRRAAQAKVDRVTSAIRALDREAWYYNTNAADPRRRVQVLDDVKRRLGARGQGETVRVLLHSIAFGTLRPYLPTPEIAPVSQKQLEMTCDVMAHSLLYWVQDLLARGLLEREARIFAMTSTGAREVWPGYGAVSAAKAALESHVRQLARELGPLGITVNAICAGVTDTPALDKMPEREAMIAAALRKNPSRRLTRPEDVASALVALAQPCTYWMNGNVIHVDGGEGHSG